MSPTLSADLEAEIAAIRANPIEAVGFGEKAYLPYEPNAPALIRGDAAAVTARLLAEARGAGDRTYRLAVLHVLGKRLDATVDAALVALLDDATTRATAAYLLGRPGFKGYPPRPRDLPTVRAALRRQLDDTTEFVDPFHRRAFRTQDFVLGAYLRIVGPERFKITNPDLADLVGLSLPAFTDAERTDLLAQAHTDR